MSAVGKVGELSTVLLGEGHCRDWDGAQHCPFFLLCFLKKINSNNRPLANPIRNEHTTSNLQTHQWSHSPWGFPSLDFPPNEQKTPVPDVSASLVSSSPKKPLLVLSTPCSRPSSPPTTTRGHSLCHFVQLMAWSLAFAAGLIQETVRFLSKSAYAFCINTNLWRKNESQNRASPGGGICIWALYEMIQNWGRSGSGYLRTCSWGLSALPSGFPEQSVDFYQEDLSCLAHWFLHQLLISLIEEAF